MSFDIEGAKKAGYSDTEIADHLAGESKFDAAAARKAGYSDADIISHVSGTKSTPTPEKAAPGNWQVTNQALNKGIAGGIDTLLNLPTNVLNLGKAAVGTVAGMAGKPEYMPELTPTPDMARKAMTRTGMINEASEPQTGLQRILDTAGQFAGGSVVNPASGIRQGVGNVVKGGLAGLLAGGTTEATGSDLAGMAAGVLAPAGMNAAGNAARRNIGNLPKPNVVLDQTLESARKEGLVIPPTTVNPSNTNRVLESIGGKAATQQAASIKNQPIIDNIARREAGLMPDEPLTPQTLSAARTRIAKPYDDLRAMGNLTVDAQYPREGLGPKPFTGALGTKTIPASEAVSEIRKLRADATSLFKLNNGNPHPDDLAKAHASQKAADQLEGLIERNLQSSGQTDLLKNFRESRVALAKNHQVEDALREGGGTIDPKRIAQSTQKGAPLTGGLKTIGDFANNFPKAALPLSQIGSPGVSKLEVGQAGAGGVLGSMLGGPVGGAIGVAGTMTVPPAVRKMLLSPKYQAYMAKTGASPSMMAKALSKLPQNTDPEAALQAITSGRIAMQPSRLSDLLGE